MPGRWDAQPGLVALDGTKVRAAAAGARAVPKPAAKRNFTDPESRIMKTADGSFHQCFNAQAVVDDDHQVIVATDLNNCAADSQALVQMTEQISDNPVQEWNLLAACHNLRKLHGHLGVAGLGRLQLAI